MATLVEHSLDDENITITHTLDSRHGEGRTVERALAVLDACGVEITPPATTITATAVVPPTYPFQHQNYWLTLTNDAGHLRVIDEALSSVQDAGTVQSAAARYAEMDPHEREAAFTDLVIDEIGRVLGNTSSETVAPGAGLLELGLNSLTVTELRSRLKRATELDLTALRVLESPTVVDLVQVLVVSYEEQKGELRSASGSTRGEGTLTDLTRQAHEDGLLHKAIEMLIEVSRFRTSSDRPEVTARPATVVPIVSEGEGPHIFCVPSFVVGSGPHQFARLARAFPAPRRVSALVLPGQRGGDRIPDSWESAVDALTRAVRLAADGAPIVLVGYSSGGIVARAIVEQLEREGDGPVGVALLDSYPLTEEQAHRVFSVVTGQLLEEQKVVIDDPALLSMGLYLRLFPEWKPGEIDASALLIRADRPLDPSLDGLDPTPWRLPDRILEVPGDHFSIIDQHVVHTASALDRWLHCLGDRTPGA
ncbi:alpha/beta fold hydrolase [Rhodococcus sp. BE178]|uniref:alpha/beta fold hydrolase n=1 Tax=Rhodococcus sp. BE178 TaxID=2817737 RepID=UPI003D1BE31F